MRGEDLTVFGDGRQTRSFCYVDDLVEGIYRLLLSDYAGPVNVGNPSEITIGQFAEEIIKLTGTTQKVIYKPLPQDEQALRALFEQLATRGPVLVVVDQPASIGADGTRGAAMPSMVRA